MSDDRSINIQVGGNTGDIKGIISGDVSGVVNLGTISGDVSNAINQLVTTSEESENQKKLQELLLQLQSLIEAEATLPKEDKVEALEQVKVLAEAGKEPQDNRLKKMAKTAIKLIRGTAAGLPDVTKLATESTSLLTAIAGLLAIL